ncbi:MAG: hypothetical protein PHO53_06325 [Actinomycetota bacterium]|nr:hypothetical protein [Actinomycetota bacterium]
MTGETQEKVCAFCGAVIEGIDALQWGEFRCPRCGVTGRYEGESMVAIFIPNYQKRIVELERLNQEITEEITLEGMKGEKRDMEYIRRKHMERQGILAEYSFLSHFSPFVDRW